MKAITNYQKATMNKAPAPVNPVNNRPNKDGCYTLTVKDPSKVVFFLENKTYVACIGHRKSEKGVEYFYPYIRDTYSGKDIVLQKVYPEGLLQDQDYNGKEILKFQPLTKSGQEFQQAWVSIYQAFMLEMSRIKEPQLQGKVVKQYIHEGSEKIKLGPKQSMDQAWEKNGTPIDGQKWSAGLTSVYCMETETGEIAMGVVLYLGYPHFETREAYLIANPGHVRNKRARTEEKSESEVVEDTKMEEVEAVVDSVLEK
jgi:hypothetical protein